MREWSRRALLRTTFAATAATSSWVGTEARVMASPGGAPVTGSRASSAVFPGLPRSKPVLIPAPQPWPGRVVCSDRSGLCAGYWQSSPYGVVGFLWRGGRLQQLPGGSRPTAINEHGVIIGDIIGRYDRQAFSWVDGKWQPLGFLGGTDTIGGWTSSAAAVNTFGVIVGTSSTDSGNSHAYRLTAGRMQDLGALGGSYSSAAAINDSGLVVGSSQRQYGSTHAFAWSNGKIRDLGTLGGSESQAVAVNNAGQIIGSSLTAAGAWHAFLWQRGHMTDLGVLPGDGVSEAVALTSRGEVLVRSTGAHPRGFLWSAGRRIELGPAASGFDPVGLNERGLVAGTMSTPSGPHAATWYRGTLTDHGTLGGPYSDVAAVTAGNMLVGSATTADLFPHAAVWPAEPEQP
ncbi:HAF repeat-containing protein [Frankia sp. Mgl5]|uniref:HAF repeat-containing protein n=1 Tax=Frankia sp. Mgl5 TaxID=2933793 RepID=UPI0027E450CC|nr:HAF repeat-containing protein [Frankia sp. Mgl5]